MKQKIWAKTLLNTYNCLETISSAIDKLVVTQGVNSGKNTLTTMENAERIINLIQRKKLMVNLKVLTENIISSLNTISSRILVMKYIDKVKPEICFELLEMSRRTFFRKLNRAIDEFALRLKQMGYNSEKMSEMLANEHWIKEYYNHYAKQEDVEQSFDYEEDEQLSKQVRKCRA